MICFELIFINIQNMNFWLRWGVRKDVYFNQERNAIEQKLKKWWKRYLNYPATQKTITIMLEAWTLAQKLKSILSHGKCRHWGRIPTNLLITVLFHVRNINFELFFTGKRTSQLAFTSSKLAMETPRNLCKVNNSDTRTTSLRCFYH